MTANSPSAHIALALANHLWQSTLVLGIIALLTLTLRHTSARIRYWLWLTASIKFLIPFSLLIGLGGYLASLHPASPQRTAQAATASLLTIDHLSQPFTLEDSPILTTTPTAPEPSMATRAAALWNRNPFIPATLVCLWLAGFLVVITRWTNRWWRIASAIRRTHPLHEGHELETLRKIERRAGLRSSIEMRSLPASMEPGIFGLIRPVLLWPQAITARLQDAHLEAVLAHEVCHVQRRDNLTAGLHMIVEALFWFHPLVWWLETRLVEERENACDETVLQICGQRRIYAESILKVCEFCVESPLACVSGVTGADLKKRIVQIMTDRTLLKLTLGKKLLLAATALLVVAVPIMLGQTRSAQRMLLAAVDTTPKPFRAAVHAMMPVEDTPSTDLIAEVQTSAPTPMSPTADSPYVPTMKFDVATARETQPDKEGHIWQTVQITPQTTHEHLSLTIKSLMNVAYGIDGFQIVGAPNWSTVYMIEAKGDADADAKIAALTKEQQLAEHQHMLQTLMEERFKLKTHWETREGNAYNLVVAKGGPKMGAEGSMPPSADEQKIFGEHPIPALHQAASNGRGLWIAHGASMSNWAALLTSLFDRPVTDKTGLTGRYDFVLKYVGNTDSDRKADDTDPTPPLDRALQEELGLKVEPAKGPVKVLVIDHIEKPTTVDGAEAPQTDHPMAKDANPAFEVASIHEWGQGQGPTGPYTAGVQFSTGRVHSQCANLHSMVFYAYHLTGSEQLEGLPKWGNAGCDSADSAGTFVIEATMPANTTDAQSRQMMQTLLTERFKFAAHWQTRQLPVYALKTTPGKSKLKPSDPDKDPPTPPHSIGCPVDDPHCHIGFCCGSTTMTSLAGILTSTLGRPVIDQTGLTGSYYFGVLKWSGDETVGSSLPSLPALLRHEFGLELEPETGPVPVLVIEHAEKPTAN